ncbi:MAG: hypothetical protein IKT40_02000 [Bacilli bacterium]|nr:hypothetical protein [Bacilli bacterium]
MISTKILKSLESNFQDPSYSIIISSFEQPEFCNKDQIKVYMQQFNPSLEKIIENKENIIDELKTILETNNITIPDMYELKINSCIQKTLTIDSILEYNTKDGLLISGLTGSLENDIEQNITSRYVKGKIQDKRVILTENDTPNYLNRTRFRIKGNRLIMSIPKKISTLNLTLIDQNTQQTTNYTEANITDNNINIDIDLTHTYSFEIRYQIYNSLLTQNIESIVTPLKKNIEIQFEKKYKKIPSVIPTINEDDKVYTSYITDFVIDENNYYTGVNITFKSLKRQKEYGDINITIIGNQASD